MASKQELQVQQKRELETKEETTVPARTFLPAADIFESQDALNVILEMPGVEKNNIHVSVQDGILRVEGRLDFSKRASDFQARLNSIRSEPSCATAFSH